MESAESVPKKVWDWKNRRPNNILTIDAGPDTGFFKWWCICMRPVVNLTNKEIDVVASFLKQRWELSKVISDPAVLDSQLMSNDTKEKVIKECNITRQHFYVLMSSLRKHKIITDSGIEPRLIPNIVGDNNETFQFLKQTERIGQGNGCHATSCRDSGHSRN